MCGACVTVLCVGTCVREGWRGRGGLWGLCPGGAARARPVLQASWPLLVSLLRRHPEGPLGTDYCLLCDVLCVCVRA